MHRPLSIFFQLSWRVTAAMFSMCFALLMHPMAPGRFLALVLSAPGATVADSYGVEYAVLFWIGAAAMTMSVVMATAQALVLWCRGPRARRMPLAPWVAPVPTVSGR